jgi:hypothetical protein
MFAKILSQMREVRNEKKSTTNNSGAPSLANGRLKRQASARRNQAAYAARLACLEIAKKKT